jgi:hypothetical protein
MLPLVIYVPLLLNLLLFHLPIVHWVYFTSEFAWSDFLMFYLNVGIWWILLLPLTPTLALLLEWIHPKTKNLKRVLLPWEHPIPLQPTEQTKRTKSKSKRMITKRSGTSSQKQKEGAAEPSGKLLLETKAEGEKHTQEDQQQLPLPLPQEITPLPENRATTSLHSSDKLSSQKSAKGKRESLRDLF